MNGRYNVQTRSESTDSWYDEIRAVGRTEAERLATAIRAQGREARVVYKNTGEEPR